ncbi:MAG: helix-turn-helix transcriptional regulator [bacterium]
MARRAAHYQTAAKADLSERQREVLALIAAGKTNGEIAERLGISLDGAKWHVSEILTKLGVSTREEAAEWWQANRGVRSRVASWARVFAPLASWKAGVAAAGVGAAGVGAAVIAVTAFAFTRGEDQLAPAVPPCVTGDVVIETIEAAGPDGSVIFALNARAAGECSFSGLARIGIGTPASHPSGTTLPTSDRRVDAVLGEAGTTIAYGVWRCTGLGSLPMTVQSFLMPTAGAPPLAVANPTFVVTRPTCPGALAEDLAVQPAAQSSFMPDLGPADKIFCYADPKWQKQCEQVDRLHQALLFEGGKDFGNPVPGLLVGLAAPRDYTCPVAGYDGTTLCTGASTGEVRAGIPVAFHGSEGDVLTVADLQQRLGTWFNGGPTRVASIGCPTSASECDARFAIAFAVDAQPAAFYLVFESTADGVALVAAGVSGDNALEIRRGGTTMTSALGETLFTPAIPPY